jgi:hypothetical protein
MAVKKFKTDIDVDGTVTTEFVIKSGALVSDFFLANGTIGSILKLLKVDGVQTFSASEKTQGRDNILAEKRSEVRIPVSNPTNQNFIDWESDILLVKTVRNFVLPTTGTIPSGSRYLVKTTSTGTVQFSTEDGTVTIEYNDIGSLGYMAQRSEAWVLFESNVYYVNGEVA